MIPRYSVAYLVLQTQTHKKFRLPLPGSPQFREPVGENGYSHPERIFLLRVRAVFAPTKAPAKALPATKMEPLSCNRMARLFRCAIARCQAQVHPGRSGLEKVDLANVGINRRRSSHLKPNLSLSSSNHMFVQSRAHVHIHVVS
jgi:hypothetical protein